MNMKAQLAPKFISTLHDVSVTYGPPFVKGARSWSYAGIQKVQSQLNSIAEAVRDSGSSNLWRLGTHASMLAGFIGQTTPYQMYRGCDEFGMEDALNARVVARIMHETKRPERFSSDVGQGSPSVFANSLWKMTWFAKLTADEKSIMSLAEENTLADGAVNRGAAAYMGLHVDDAQDVHRLDRSRHEAMQPAIASLTPAQRMEFSSFLQSALWNRRGSLSVLADYRSSKRPLVRRTGDFGSAHEAALLLMYGEKSMLWADRAIKAFFVNPHDERYASVGDLNSGHVAYPDDPSSAASLDVALIFAMLASFYHQRTNGGASSYGMKLNYNHTAIAMASARMSLAALSGVATDTPSSMIVRDFSRSVIEWIEGCLTVARRADEEGCPLQVPEAMKAWHVQGSDDFAPISGSLLSRQPYLTVINALFPHNSNGRGRDLLLLHNEMPLAFPGPQAIGG